MCVKREGVGNLCGGLFTILMLIIMFSVAHRRFQELIYIGLAFVAITLTLCIIIAIFNTLYKGEPLLDYWDANNSQYYHSRRHSSRYRHHTNNSHNPYNQQRVVCAPPTMGGARLNIIYTIGQQQNNANVRRNQTSNPLDRQSVAIDIDNTGAHLYPNSTSMSSSHSPDSTSPCPPPPPPPPQYMQFSPLIAVNSENLQQIIDEYNQMDSRHQLDSDIINGLNYQMSDLPPLYHQLDVIPTDGPPSYEEAIEDKENTNK